MEIETCYASLFSIGFLVCSVLKAQEKQIVGMSSNYYHHSRSSLTRSSERILLENNPKKTFFSKMGINYRKEFSDKNKEAKVNIGECYFKTGLKNKVQVFFYKITQMAKSKTNN